MITLTLALRYLRGRVLRTVLTTLAIVFGVLVVFGMNSLVPAFTTAFTANVMAAAGQVDATITLKTADVFDEAAASVVAGVDGVRASAGLLDRTVNVPANYFDGDPTVADSVSALALVGLDVEAATRLHAYQVTAGRFLEPGDTTAAVISQSLADSLGLNLGDTLKLPTTNGEVGLIITGIQTTRGLPGTEEVLVTLPQAQAMLGMDDRINAIEVNFDSIEEGRRAEIEANILTALGDVYQVGALSANSELLNNIGVAQGIFSLLGVLALLMGAFIIFNTFRTIVAERRRDIGMLRSLGASRRTIFGIILGEGLVQGVAGTALGLLLGYLLSLLMVALLSPIMERFMNMSVPPPATSPALVLVSVLLGVGVTLLAGLLPAISATRVTPLDALRPSVAGVAFRRMAGLGFWTGAAMIAAAVLALLTQNVGLIALGGVLFVAGLILAAPALVNPIANLFAALAAAIFARAGTAHLAQGNLARQPGRAAVTASTTLIALAIVVMASSLISSVSIGFVSVMRKSLGSDFLLVPPSIAVWGTNVGASEDLETALRAVDGVEVVSGLRYAPTQADGLSISLLGIDPASYPQVSGLTFTAGDEAAAYAALTSGRSVILNGLLATNTGAGLGDEVELLTPSGPRAYRVVGIGSDYLNAKITTAYISHDNIAADFGRTEDVFIQINLAAGADAARVETALAPLLANYPQFRFVSGQAYIEENLAIFDAVFAGMIGLVIVLSVPSLIAMVNTLAIGVIERTREIGMLRAVGATRGQVRTIIVAEAVILAAIGTAFGLLAGLYMGYLVVQTFQAVGYPMDYVFPASGIVLVIAAGLIFGVLAALIPARQAARLEVVRALRYE